MISTIAGCKATLPPCTFHDGHGPPRLFDALGKFFIKPFYIDAGEIDIDHEPMFRMEGNHGALHARVLGRVFGSPCDRTPPTRCWSISRRYGLNTSDVAMG